MITITIKKNHAGFTSDGHANYARHGADIICSAVSAITQTALYGLMDYTQPSFAMKDGYLDVDLIEHSSETIAILRTMEKGLRAIKAQYGDYVDIKEEEDGEEDTRI